MSLVEDPLAGFFEQQGFVILDGALATELEALGADLNDPLWSAKVLLEAPQLIEAVHRKYLEAGADIISTSTYQASFKGFEQKGLRYMEASRIFDLSVDLAVKARDQFWLEPENRVGRQFPVIAGSLGPYGAHLADGSEYTGDYDSTIAELKNWHRPQVEVLCNKGLELLLFETIPSLLEVKAIVSLMSEFPAQAIALSCSCCDGEHIAHGEKLLAVFQEVMAAPQLVALGVNCTPPKYITPLLKSLEGKVSKPMMVYPNSGEVWNAEQHFWTSGEGVSTFQIVVEEWYSRGASIIGGCCRTTPDQIRQIRRKMEQLLKPL